MESEKLRRNEKKRQVVEISDGGSSDEVYRFKILLPNGTSVGLNVRDPVPEMPFGDFIALVKEEYLRVQRHSESMKRKRSVNWKIGSLVLQDDHDVKMGGHVVNFRNFKPHKCHILRLHDGSGESSDTFENMWDLTPDTELLKELPEDYTFETALADLIDNSIQAVWSNSKNERRFVRVDVLEDRISIFDTGSGMDASNENSIVKWGKIGASLHRSSKEQAIGGKPPYLKPFFGMFGYGGPIASMHLGRHATVSSKTKKSKKVYILHLKREALLSSSGSELTWKTSGGIRDPLEEEISQTPHGSFTKVEIFEPKIKSLDTFQLQCRLKDIYFPYIQCDEMSNAGKTIRPIEFQVNGIDLAEIEGGEVATTNLHSSNGPDFVLQLHFSLNQDNVTNSPAPSSRSYREANARLKFVYFPVVEGKESIEKILEKLKVHGHKITENWDTYSHVSIRRLGRLLPDARWTSLPFMDLRHKKGSSKAQILRSCWSRVKCFIDTDSGYNPTQSKTDLAHHNPFTVALMNFGNNLPENDKGVNIKVYRDGKLLSPSQVEKEYHDWILQMHMHYDEEVDHGEDQPVLVVSPSKRKEIGISSDVMRVHKVLKRKGETWKSGQKIKILKGACSGVHKNNVYATLEYFLLGGFEGDVGGEARIICRPLGIPDKKGCILSEVNGETILDKGSSLSIPVSVIDSGKCICMGSTEWNQLVEKKHQTSPSTIDMLNTRECQELEVDGEELPVTANAGKATPKEVVAVVRPANYIPQNDPKDLDQKYISRCKTEMSLEVKFNGKKKDVGNDNHVYSARFPPCSRKGIHGLYIFPLRSRVPNLFQKAGVYTFSLSLTDSSCKTLVKKVNVDASSEIRKWELLSNKQSRPYRFRVGMFSGPVTIGGYDIYDNRTRFTSNPQVLVKFQAKSGIAIHVKDFKIEVSTSGMELKIKDLLIQSSGLDKIRPTYEASLVISSLDKQFVVFVPCHVTPGCIKVVRAQPSTLASQLHPGCIIGELELEMFDAYDNHVREGSEVRLNLEGFQILDQQGFKRKVNNCGRIDLGGLLRVTADYGENVSFSVSSDNDVLMEQKFQIEKRELRLVSKVPEVLASGSVLENMVFEIVNSEGIVDDTIHDEDELGQSHMLTIKADSHVAVESIRYTFKHGRCVVPAITLPQREGGFCFLACHSRHSNLNLSIKVNLVKPAMPMITPKLEYGEIESRPSDRRILLLQDSSTHQQVEKEFTMSIVSIENKKKNLENELVKMGASIGELERLLDGLKMEKEKLEQTVKDLEESIRLCLPGFPNCFYTREELIEEIEKIGNSAAAVICNIFRRVSFQEQQNRLMKDLIGVVALLGRVNSSQHSRILSKYLGMDQMLAVVTRSFEAANLLEKYIQNEVDCSGTHLEAGVVKLLKSIRGHFIVLCLEDISPYVGRFDRDGFLGSQKKLPLPVPCLSDGTVPTGFLGFAVNMIDLDVDQLQIKTNSGHGLRETLFYSLFGQLQVYRTRVQMLAARDCIKHGAVSLDGGILRENGRVILGTGDPGICFQVVTSESDTVSQETLKQLAKKKSQLRMLEQRIRAGMDVRKENLREFNKKNNHFLSLSSQVDPILRYYYFEFGTDSTQETTQETAHA